MESHESLSRAGDRYVLTQPYLLELYRRLRPRVLIVLGIVLGVPVLVYCITKIAWRAVWSLVTGAAFLEGVSMWLSVALLLAYIVGLVWILFAPRRKAKRFVRRAEELFGALPEIRITFFADDMLVQIIGKDVAVRIGYAAIAACRETQNLFLLITKEKQVIPVAKQGLLETDEAEFRTLIGHKCPNLK